MSGYRGMWKDVSLASLAISNTSKKWAFSEQYSRGTITDVEGRTGILFHAANLVSQLLGCVAMGIRRGKLGGEEAVLSSGAALNSRFIR